MSDSQEFAGKVVVVTGASSGIGARTAQELSRRGARVVLVARNEDKLKTVAASCPAQCEPVVADLARDDHVARVVAEALAAFGRIDVLVNNAGMAMHASFGSPNAVSAYERVMAVNLHSVVKLTHAALPHLVASKGNVVNVSSVAAMSTISGSWSYCVTKAALNSFTKCLSEELAAKGVRVNAVNPGPVKTDILDHLPPQQAEAVFENMRERTTLKRISEPQEIADVIAFLASDKARGVTGSCWVTDNGALTIPLL